jgi:hypothetical protein
VVVDGCDECVVAGGRDADDGVALVVRGTGVDLGVVLVVGGAGGVGLPADVVAGSDVVDCVLVDEAAVVWEESVVSVVMASATAAPIPELDTAASAKPAANATRWRRIRIPFG